MTAALKNIKIIELGHVIAGPLAATLLGDFGAEVIKIEQPGAGDMARELGPKADDGVGVWWKSIARNKRLLALDWKTEEGREILLSLLETADVLIENFRPGVLERAGLTPAVLLERNPDLVILRVSGYGQDGPLAKMPTFGRAAECMSGLPYMSGFSDGPPMHPGFPAGDASTGLMGAFGIMMALYAIKDGQSRGQVIDLAVFEPLLRLIDYHVPTSTGTGRDPKRNGTRQPMDFAPGGMFQTRDGRWVTVSAGSVETANRMLRAAGGDDFADDRRFSSMEGISQNMDEITTKLEAFISSRDFDDIAADFARHDAVIAPVLSVDEIINAPQVKHRGDIISVDGETTQVVAPIPHMTDTPGSVRWLGKGDIGADSIEVLRKAGLSQATISDLVDRGIVDLPEK